MPNSLLLSDIVWTHWQHSRKGKGNEERGAWHDHVDGFFFSFLTDILA